MDEREQVIAEKALLAGMRAVWAVFIVVAICHRIH